MLNRYLYARNRHEIELTIAKTVKHPDLIIIGMYRSPRVVLSSLLTAIRTTLYIGGKSFFTGNIYERF